MNARKIAFLLLPLGLLLGCASLPPLSENQAMIAPHVVFTIPPPSSLGESINVAQSIIVHYRGKPYAFETQIQVTPEQLDLVALDGLGRRALTVTWTPSGISCKQASWLPTAMRPADILAAIMIAYWPGKIVAFSFPDFGAALVDNGNKREIRMGKHDLVTVDYGAGEGWNRAATLQNLAFGYEIDVQSSLAAP